MPSPAKYLGTIVEYLDDGRLKPGLVVREHERQLSLIDAGGREKTVARELVLLRHNERKADARTFPAAASAIDQERARLAGDLDLELLWDVVREQEKGFTAAELAELFFGDRSASATAAMLEALLNDKLYFVRRHMEFVARTAEQVERLRVQQERVRMRSDDARRTQALIREIIADGGASSAEAGALIGELQRYLANPFTRSREMTAMLSQAVAEASPAEVAYEILGRLGAAPEVPRFVAIGGLRTAFSEDALSEATRARAAARTERSGIFPITIDDEDTREIDDALSCEPLPDGGLRVRIHIALVADFVVKDSAMDREAASRAATVYLPEATVPMLPDAVSSERASLVAGELRPVLTTEVLLSPEAELLEWSIAPEVIRIGARLSYVQADAMLSDNATNGPAATALRPLYAMAAKIRERRRNAGAALFQRRESKVRVEGDQIEIKVLETASASRMLVGEFMVMTNHMAARMASEKGVPIIYRVQPSSGGDLTMARPRLSLYPEYHAGIGVDCYAQVSSPIRRYADLVLQRQLLAALAGAEQAPYSPDELLKILANVETADTEARELERRAKRYWTLRYLSLHAMNSRLEAYALRDGATGELCDYAIRGTLHNAPNLANETRVMVRLTRVDPLRGWLAMEYDGPVAGRTGEGAPL